MELLVPRTKTTSKKKTVKTRKPAKPADSKKTVAAIPRKKADRPRKGKKIVAVTPAKKITAKKKGRPELPPPLPENPPAAVTEVHRIRCDIGAHPLVVSPQQRQIDLSQSRLYLNRELTWLNFNRRVLYEAENERNPLLERVKFLAIVSSNLDEFFMKRIGGLRQLIGFRIQDLSVDGRTPLQQLRDCHVALKQIDQARGELYPRLLEELRRNDIYLLGYDELDETDRAWLRDYFIRNIFPLVTPQGIDSAHPFPFISNLSLNLLASVRHSAHETPSWTRVKVPIGPDVPRFIRLRELYRFVKVEDVFQQNLDLLFPAVEVDHSELFRVTRNANTEKDEEQADDLLELIEEELRDRKFAPIVRLQVRRGMDRSFRRLVLSELELDDEEDVFETDSMLGMRDLFEIAALPIPGLKYQPHHPIDPPRWKSTVGVFENLRKEGPILLYHPYESFSNSVERFLREASQDPLVRAIKMTIYRTSAESKVIEYLIDAAQNGKQVAVVVELKARFDEAANIRWANRLEEIGIHATYGVIGYKTHAKTILVIRKDHDGLRQYSHIGTGNYNAGTARLYTDLGLLTADPVIGDDLTELFNFLTSGLTPQRKYHKILTAPSDLKKTLLAKIEREARIHRADNPGLIQMKVNALEDSDVVRGLYEASRAGVKIDLIVRDSCRLRPGIPGLSETVSVVSIIGRFLEHARIIYFRNGGDEEYYLGSADIMRRNLEKRVEVVTPVEDPILRGELRKILDVQFGDTTHVWVMRSDGSYERIIPPPEADACTSQEILIEIAEKRRRVAAKLKKLHSHGKSKKELWAGH